MTDDGATYVNVNDDVTMTELRTGTRKGFVVILVPNEENVRMDFIGGTRKVFAVWGHAEFAEGTGKRHTKNIRSSYCPE